MDIVYKKTEQIEMLFGLNGEHSVAVYLTTEHKPCTDSMSTVSLLREAATETPGSPEKKDFNQCTQQEVETELSKNRKALQWVIKSAQNIIGTSLDR